MGPGALLEERPDIRGQLRDSGAATFTIGQAAGREVAVHDIGTQVFGADVGWVGLAENLSEAQALVPDPFLDP